MRKQYLFIILPIVAVLLISCSSAKTENLGNTGQSVPSEDSESIVSEVKNFWGYEMPDSEGIDYWICDKFTEKDEAECQELYDIMGARRFANPKYKLLVDSEEDYIYSRLPDHHVAYIVTPYPDYSDYKENGSFVTEIWITDPEVSLFGINVNCTAEEFGAAMTENGFSKWDGDGSRRDRYYSPDEHYFIELVTSENLIRIDAPVENRNGLVF